MSLAEGSATSISVFFPAYNDAASLRLLIPKACAVLGAVAPDFEVIVVDDGSTDDTPGVLTELAGRFPSLRVVRHERNRGYGAALRSGFGAATRPLIFYTDGDGQYDVAELPGLLARLTSGVDVVNGYKIQRADAPYRRLLGWFYHALVRTLFDVKVRDIDCDFRLLRCHVLEAVPLTFSSGAICAELMTQVERAGFRIEEVPVHHYPRQSGKSQFFRLSPVARMIWDVMRLWVRLVLLRRGPEKFLAGQPSAPAAEGTRPRIAD